MSEEGKLGSHRCRNSIGGARKDHEEAFFIRLDLVAMKLEERGAQDGLTGFQEAGVAFAQLL